MRIVADFHIHSKYAMATSKFMVPEEIARWAKIKGVNVIGTGDCTHPLWIKVLKEKLEPAEDGLYRLKRKTKNEKGKIMEPLRGETEPRFMVTGEVACIYNQGKKNRRVHIHFWLPSLEAAERLNKKLEKAGAKIYSDGRPVLGMSAKDLAKIIFEVDERSVVVPAHIWTPWFGILGSKSGFESIEECFEELTDKIFALETGLSSDPPMNWRLSQLDKYALISNSDAHSGRNIMREANIFELQELSYDNLVEAVKSKDPKKFLYTVEFYPEEGMYHWDGSRKKGICLSPEEMQTLRLKNPSLAKSLTVGVEHRVFDLSDRQSFIEKKIEAESGKKFMAGRPIDPPKWGIGYVNLVSLDDILAEAMKVGVQSKRVQEEYFRIIQKCGPEFSLFFDLNIEEIEECAGAKIAQGIASVREGQISIRPGYDGVYGEVKVFGDEDEGGQKSFSRQPRLF